MRTLGLDLGTNSVGWALVTEKAEGEAPDIECGVYVFPEAGELDGVGLFESHRHKRGIKRRMRRNLARKRQRRDRLVRLLRENGMHPASDEEFVRLYHSHVDSQGRPAHPYALRKRGLDEKLTLEELGRALYHICRRRGYLSTALLKLKKLEEAGLRPTRSEAAAAEEREEESGETKSEEAKERSALKRRMAEVRAKIEAGNARTLGEFYAERLEERVPVRGCGPEKAKKIGRKDALGLRAERELFEDEFHRLWDAQAKFHPRLTNDLKTSFYEAIFSQRDLRSTAHLVGCCEFIKDRRRAPRASMPAQHTILLQTLVNMKIQEKPGAEPRPLSPQEVMTVSTLMDWRTEPITWDELREILNLPRARFRDEPEETAKGRRGKSRRATPGLRPHKTVTAMKEALGQAWDDLSLPRRDDLVNRLMDPREFGKIAPGLRRDFGLTDDQLYRLAVASLPDGHMNHCTRVLRKIEPYLKQGLTYDKACVAAGYREANTSTEAKVDTPVERLEFTARLNNPIVERSVQSAVKVINAILRHYGKPDRIRIEMPREVSKTNKQREDIWRKQDENAAERKRAADLLRSNGLQDTDINIKKVRLWWEAGERCPYSPTEMIGLTQLIEDYDIDHIVPRSVCYDDSWANLTICPRTENIHVKGKQTPFQAYGRTNAWPDIVTYVRRSSMPGYKKDRILCEEWNAEDFTNRALSDTRYISRVILTEVKTLGVDVQVSRGQMTALLRAAWELGGCIPASPEQQEKIRAWRDKAVKKQEKPRFDHRHHALDAILAALTDIRTLQGLTRFFQQQEQKGLPWKEAPKSKPWPTISQDLARLMETCTVVHAPTRGISGPLHEETARKPPPQERVDEAIAALPADWRTRMRRCVVVGKQLVHLDEKGKALKAYDLGSNHHAVIWESEEPDKQGRHRREFTIVTMIEASRRAQAGMPVIDKTRDGYRYVLALCVNDIVEWDTDGERRLMRVTTRTEGDIHLLPINDAKKDMSRVVRVRGSKDCPRILRRVVLDPVGRIVGSEPTIPM